MRLVASHDSAIEDNLVVVAFVSFSLLLGVPAELGEIVELVGQREAFGLFATLTLPLMLLAWWIKSAA